MIFRPRGGANILAINMCRLAGRVPGRGACEEDRDDDNGGADSAWASGSCCQSRSKWAGRRLNRGAIE